MCSAAGAMPSHCLWAIISQPFTLLLTVSTNRRPGYTGRGRNIVGRGLFGNESHNWAVWYLGRQRKRRKDQRDPPSTLRSPAAHPANAGNRNPSLGRELSAQHRAPEGTGSNPAGQPLQRRAPGRAELCAGSAAALQQGTEGKER